jgi:valyl-tRNA synthetase
MMPFITEEIWQKTKTYLPALAHRDLDSIMVAPYPRYDASLLDQTAERHYDLIKSMIMAVRTLRGEMNLHPTTLLPVLLRTSNEETKRLMTQETALVQAMAKVATIDWVENEKIPLSATQLFNDIELMIPLAGLVDKSSELTRLQKEMEKLDKEISGCEISCQSTR